MSSRFSMSLMSYLHSAGGSAAREANGPRRVSSHRLLTDWIRAVPSETEGEEEEEEEEEEDEKSEGRGKGKGKGAKAKGDALSAREKKRPPNTGGWQPSGSTRTRRKISTNQRYHS